MKPTDELRHEHEIILHMLSGAERTAQSIQSAGAVDAKKVEDIIDFSRHFTDGCHHAKEERNLFVRLQEHGMPQGQGPIAVMLQEHETGRECIQSIETALKVHQAGDVGAAYTIGRNMLEYVELLRAHISKENNVLLPLSDRLLTPNDQRSLEESFKAIEEHEVGAGVHEKYHRMAHDIAEQRATPTMRP
jgi:hemerythrin-like domain-containing protein